ncbi:MAG: pentapeptide repeat-containing protein, partial [Nitrososphaerales archaeon]
MSHRTVVRVQLVGFLVATSLGLGVTIQVPGTVPASAQTVVDGCTVVSNPTPTDYTECPDKNLSSANFQGLDLQYANLSGDTFAYCTNISEDQGCAGTAFEDANLEDSNVSDSLFDVWEIVMPPGQPFGTFYGAEANLTGATMSGTNASGITGGLINWSKTAVNDVNFTGATLSEEQFGSDFAGDDLTDTNFTEAQLDGVDFIGAKVGEANFNNAKVAQASFTETVLVPQNQTVEATSRHGAKVTWSTPPPIEGLTPGACSPASGSRFPIGTTEP